jgi:3-phenylpropionate/cinnamic acid dioxygenase small subunit
VSVASRYVSLLELKDEIENFLYREAELLDERRFREWLELLADDLVYFMPIRRNVKFGEQEARENTRCGADISWFDEDKWTLTKRVDQLLTGIHWAEEPLSRVSHLITNIQITEVRPHLQAVEELKVKSHFLVYQNRVERETVLFVGRRVDVIRRVDEGWRLSRREILLDQNVLQAKSLTVFF